MAHQAGAYPGFRSMKRLGVFLLPPGGMLVHRRVTPSSKFAGTHLYTWVERGTIAWSKVSCPRTQRSAPARARTRTVRSGVQRTNHEATAPPTHFTMIVPKDGQCHTVVDLDMYLLRVCNYSLLWNKYKLPTDEGLTLSLPRSES